MKKKEKSDSEKEETCIIRSLSKRKGKRKWLRVSVRKKEREKERQRRTQLCYNNWQRRKRIIGQTTLLYVYHLESSDYWLPIHCYTHNVLVDASFRLLQAFPVELRSPCILFKVLCWHPILTPEEGWRTHLLKCCVYSNEVEDNSLKIQSYKIYQPSSVTYWLLTESSIRVAPM